MTFHAINKCTKTIIFFGTTLPFSCCTAKSPLFSSSTVLGKQQGGGKPLPRPRSPSNEKAFSLYQKGPVELRRLAWRALAPLSPSSRSLSLARSLAVAVAVRGLTLGVEVSQSINGNADLI